MLANTYNMTAASYLNNHFLIAMPALEDPNFFHSVTYVCEHNEQGAMGIVINQPLDISLSDVLTHMDMSVSDSALDSIPVYLGGPVQPDRGFVLHEPIGEWDSMLEVTKNIGMTTSRDILEALNDGKGPHRSLVALGYAGWGQGQLEHELLENAWLTCPADSAIMFDTPIENRWTAAAASLGIDISTLSDNIGHA